VLRHGLADRLRGGRAGRGGRWGDAFAVALVLALVVQAAAGVAIVARAFLAHPDGVSPELAAWLARAHVPFWYAPFANLRSALFGLAAAGAASGAAVAACLGRVRATRALAVAAAVGGVAAFRVELGFDQGVPFRSAPGLLVVAAGVLVLAVVLRTGAVARAATLVPRAWWGYGGLAALGGASSAMAMHGRLAVLRPFFGRIGLVAAAYAAAALAVAIVALAVAWRVPALAGGAAVLLAATAPLTPALLLIDPVYGNDVPFVAALWPFVLLLVPLALLARRRTA
jgi:hypothetical protein